MRPQLHGALPVGTRLRAYEIQAVLGHGGFGITYLARDTALGREVAIKEYMPASLASRQEGTTVVPRSTEFGHDFRWGLERFLEEARTLATFDGAPGIVRVLDYLEANGTAYMVMALIKGDTLAARLKARGPLDPDTLQRILPPLLNGLEAVHALGFLHRDIKPSNIVVDADGVATLIDFGASRQAMAERSTTVTAVFSPGYAAPEQMSSSRQQGPWTDIYGLAATLYQAITGRIPPSAVDRVQEDTLIPLAKLKPPNFPPTLLSAIDAGLAVRASQRPQSIGKWRELLFRKTTGLATSSLNRRARRTGTGVWLGTVGTAVIVACALLLAVWQRDRAPSPMASASEEASLQVQLRAALGKIVPSQATTSREAEVQRYLAASNHKALAAAPPSNSWQTSAWSTTDAAERHTLEACQVRYGKPCVLLAVDGAMRPETTWATPSSMPRVTYEGTFDPKRFQW